MKWFAFLSVIFLISCEMDTKECGEGCVVVKEISSKRLFYKSFGQKLLGKAEYTRIHNQIFDSIRNWESNPENPLFKNAGNNYRFYMVDDLMLFSKKPNQISVWSMRGYQINQKSIDEHLKKLNAWKKEMKEDDHPVKEYYGSEITLSPSAPQLTDCYAELITVEMNGKGIRLLGKSNSKTFDVNRNKLRTPEEVKQELFKGINNYIRKCGDSYCAVQEGF